MCRQLYRLIRCFAFLNIFINLANCLIPETLHFAAFWNYMCFYPWRLRIQKRNHQARCWLERRYNKIMKNDEKFAVSKISQNSLQFFFLGESSYWSISIWDSKLNQQKPYLGLISIWMISSGRLIWLPPCISSVWPLTLPYSRSRLFNTAALKKKHTQERNTSKAWLGIMEETTLLCEWHTSISLLTPDVRPCGSTLTSAMKISLVDRYK